MSLSLKAKLMKNDIYMVISDLYRDRQMSIMLPYGTSFKTEPQSNEVQVYREGDLIRYLGAQITQIGEVRVNKHMFDALMPVSGMPAFQIWSEEDLETYAQLQTKAGGESNES